ncbi:MAG: hypothetical protein ABFC62_12170 [Clostridiaceae bacterium]|nr:hypothetical protein [Eubacteriales bacterium]
MAKKQQRFSSMPRAAARPSRAMQTNQGRNMLFDAKKYFKWVFFALAVTVVALFWISGIVRNFKDKADPHTRSYNEFSSVFNESMATQGIAVGEDTEWDTSTTWYETTHCVLTLPDGGEIPCHIELWGYSLRQTPIMSVEMRFTSEQKEYLIPIVQGIFDVFEPKLDGQVLTEITEFCKSCFGQEAYEKKWKDLPHGYFYLTSDAPDAVTAKWFFLD